VAAGHERSCANQDDGIRRSRSGALAIGGSWQTGSVHPYSLRSHQQAREDAKLLLAFDALLLSEMLGHEVSLGKLIQGDDYAVLNVNTSTLAVEVRKHIDKTVALLSSSSPPDLVLIRHCTECEEVSSFHFPLLSTFHYSSPHHPTDCRGTGCRPGRNSIPGLRRFTQWRQGCAQPREQLRVVA
jgi:hypothetical protein